MSIMRQAELLVWCEATGYAHDPDDPDPEQEGPQHADADTNVYYRGNSAWELRTDPAYGEVKYWFYTCPGPHFRLWIGKEL